MDLRERLIHRRRRRLVDLRFRPGLQLKLPALMIAISTGFCLLFAVHTDAAYGAVLRIGLEEPWLRVFLEEIRHDYLAVSLAIGAAYAFTVLGLCLAGTHRVFGPIGALERYVADLAAGRRPNALRLRSGHPLAEVVRGLNELAEALEQDAVQPEQVGEAAGAPEARVARRAGDAVDRLLEVYALERGDADARQPGGLVSAVG